MSRRNWFVLALLLPATLALASARDDYASQWPLVMSGGDAGAYRVTLDASVYRQIQDPGLVDLAVLDSAGTPVPASVFSPEVPAKRSQTNDVPWFPLPMPDARGDGERAWELVREVESGGSLRRVATIVRERTPTASPPRALLVDLGRDHHAVTALQLEWRPPTEALDLAYRLEASDDLNQWHALRAQGRIMDLQRDGQRLQKRIITLAEAASAGPQYRYLRLLPEASVPIPDVTRIRAELDLAAPAVALEWRELEGRRARQDGRTIIEYQLDGRFPIRQLDVALAGNHAVQWRLESRDDPTGEWRLRAGPWTAWRVDEAGRGSRSAPQTLAAPVRDRYWRLSTPAQVQGEPSLRLGYRPETLVFLPAQPGPHILVAGSARPSVGAGPVKPLVAALRAQRGADWQPAQAALGPPAVLAGNAALTPRRDWTTWTLWGVLVLAALIVGGLAVRVLRALPPASGSSSG